MIYFSHSIKIKEIYLISPLIVRSQFQEMTGDKSSDKRFFGSTQSENIGNIPYQSLNVTCDPLPGKRIGLGFLIFLELEGYPLTWQWSRFNLPTRNLISNSGTCKLGGFWPRTYKPWISLTGPMLNNLSLVYTLNWGQKIAKHTSSSNRKQKFYVSDRDRSKHCTK